MTRLIQGLKVTRPETEAQGSGFAKVFSFLREQLLDGTIRSGDRLVPERELALQLGVSRPIVRERTLEDHPTNWHLSAHRAIAVGGVLLDAGYDPQRISVVGCGEHRPIVENDSESNMAQNRRVDIYIVPRGTLVASGLTTSRMATK